MVAAVFLLVGVLAVTFASFRRFATEALRFRRLLLVGILILPILVADALETTSKEIHVDGSVPEDVLILVVVVTQPVFSGQLLPTACVIIVL